MVPGSFWRRWRWKLLGLFFTAQYYVRMIFLNLRAKIYTIPHDEINAQAQNYWQRLYEAQVKRDPLAAALQTAKRGLQSESITAALQVVKRGMEHEPFNTALQTARKGLESESVTATLQAIKKHEPFTSTLQAVKEHEPFTTTLQTVKKGLTNEHVTSKLRAVKIRLEKIAFIEETPTQPLDLSPLERLQAFADSPTAQYSLEKLKATRQMVEKANTQQSKKLAVIALIVVASLLGVFFTQNILTGKAMQVFKSTGMSTLPLLGSSALDIVAQQKQSNINASKALVRISQLDPDEYSSHSDFNTWAYSACSTASMTEVFNAYGHHYKIANVLQTESAIGAITPQLGLTSDAGIANTAAQFGFQTNWGDNWTLNQVIKNANAGHPVIVGWPPSLYPEGHIVVVIRGDARNVYLADSSLWDRTALPRAQFLQWWSGFAAVVTPT